MQHYYKPLIVVLIVATTVWLIQWDATRITAPATIVADAIGQPVPNVTFMRLGGGGVALHSLQGKPIWLHFWASWCAPCRAEFQTLLELIAADPTKPILLAVSADANHVDAKKFIVPYKRKFPELFARDQVIIGIDSSRILIEGAFQTFQYPETIVIDAKGLMQQKIIGAMRAP